MASATAADASDFAAFGRARIAAANGNPAVAAEQYRIALTAAPSSKIVATRAFRQGMAAGDLALSRRAVLAMGADQPYDARVLTLADAIKGGDAKAIEAAITAFDKTPLSFLQPIIRAWLNLGSVPDATAGLTDPKQGAAIGHVVNENRVLILIAQNEILGGARGLENELAANLGGLDLRYSAAELLMGQGRDGLARRVLGGDLAAVASVRDKLRPAKGTAAFGIARLFTRIASDLNDANTSPIAVTLTRAALILDVGHDRARILLASALDRSKAYDRALATLDEIAPASPFRSMAQADRIEVLRDKGELAAAIAAAMSYANAPGADANSAEIYGNLLLAADRSLEAAVAYEKARDRQGDATTWQIWLQIASAYERADRWPLARAAFERSLALGPEQAIVLNYYGYGLVERDQELPRAVTMLEKANALAPGQPSIADSLALAYFRSGKSGKALPLLEAALLQSPSNPDIAEHLGDIYWAVGRRYEARYAWRVSRLVAAPRAVKRLDAKIQDGPAPANL